MEKTVRKGWAESASLISEAADDNLVLGEFANAGDDQLEWPSEGASKGKSDSDKRSVGDLHRKT